MDSMKIKSDLGTHLISRIVSSVVEKKLSKESHIVIYSIEAKLEDGKLKFRTEVSGELEKNDLIRLLEKGGVT